MKEIISIQISKFLTNDLAEKIAHKQWKSSAPSWINRSRQYIFDELINDNDCFGVVATSSNNDVVGRLHCIKSEDNPNLWYYGDLFVIPEYRRLGIATQMIRAAINHLSDKGATTLRCYVEPNNTQSRSLQISVGFLDRPFESFNNLTNDGEIMYELEIPNCLTIIPATIDEAYFVRILFAQNKNELNTENISLSEWKSLLSSDDADEKHFLICKGAMPVAYMKINGLTGTYNAWLSMLFVAKNFQRQGIGSFAVKYAEKYILEKGFSMLSIQTTSDNISAQNCYLKLGYQIFEQNDRIKYRKILQ
ncbi:MAG: GNAT family N-acetyltransferase [Clostridia bacterium]|nr:GNAT family N-acetyltransferase [Clostridia bacterium]